jgi:hypothetical protein
VARVVTPTGWSEIRSTGSDLRSRVATMWRLAGRYADGPYRRVTRHGPWGRGASCRVRYEPLSANDCLRLVEQSLTLPAGVTRFQVSDRFLDARASLAQLAAAGQDRRAAQRLLARLHSASDRFSAEPGYEAETA